MGSELRWRSVLPSREHAVQLQALRKRYFSTASSALVSRFRACTDQLLLAAVQSTECTAASSALADRSRRSSLSSSNSEEQQDGWEAAHQQTQEQSPEQAQEQQQQSQGADDDDAATQLVATTATTTAATTTTIMDTPTAIKAWRDGPSLLSRASRRGHSAATSPRSTRSFFATHTPAAAQESAAASTRAAHCSQPMGENGQEHDREKRAHVSSRGHLPPKKRSKGSQEGTLSTREGQSASHRADVCSSDSDSEDMPDSLPLSQVERAVLLIEQVHNGQQEREQSVLQGTMAHAAAQSTAVPPAGAQEQPQPENEQRRASSEEAQQQQGCSKQQVEAKPTKEQEEQEEQEQQEEQEEQEDEEGTRTMREKKRQEEQTQASIRQQEQEKEQEKQEQQQQEEEEEQEQQRQQEEEQEQQQQQQQQQQQARPSDDTLEELAQAYPFGPPGTLPTALNTTLFCVQYLRTCCFATEQRP